MAYAVMEAETRIDRRINLPTHPDDIPTKLMLREQTMRAPVDGHLRVLLVEDAPFLRYAFGRLLRMQGFEVIEANDGQEALDCLNDFHPDLVLTDLMMPVMGGVELIRRLRANPLTADLPVVAITADATDHAESQARAAGAVDVITKPIDLPHLLDRLRSIGYTTES